MVVNANQASLDILSASTAAPMAPKAEGNTDESVSFESVLMNESIANGSAVDLAAALVAESLIPVPVDFVNVEALVSGDLTASEVAPVVIPNNIVSVENFAVAENLAEENVVEVIPETILSGVSHGVPSVEVKNPLDFESKIDETNTVPRVVMDEQTPVVKEASAEQVQNPIAETQNISNVQSFSSPEKVTVDSFEDKKTDSFAQIERFEDVAVLAPAPISTNEVVTVAKPIMSDSFPVRVTNQVIEQITRNLSNVKTFQNEISFVLNPKNLGRVAVKMSIVAETLTVELTASSKETQNILAANLENIKDVLRNMSADNQVNQYIGATQHDYLEDQSQENQSHSNGNQPENESQRGEETPSYTEDFLKVLNFMSSNNI